MLNKLPDLFTTANYRDDFFPKFPSLSLDEFFNATTQLTNKTFFFENENEYIFKAAVPGFKKDEISIILDENKNILTVSAQKSENKKCGKDCKIVKSFEFIEEVVIPKSIKKDKIEAKLKDGILEIKIPKEEKDSFKIPIQ